MFKKRTQRKPTTRSRVPLDRTVSNKVFSYYSVRRPVEVYDNEVSSARRARNQEAAKNSRYIGVKRFVALAVFIVLAGVVVYNMRLTPNHMHIVMRGTPEQRLHMQHDDVYRRAAADFLKQKLSNQTKLTFNVKDLNTAMTERFPEVKNVNAYVPIFGTGATVYIEPSSAALVVLTKDNKSYVVDSSGRVISTNTDKVPASLPRVTDEAMLSPDIGAQILPSSDVKAIYTIMYQLRKKGIEIESMHLPVAAQRLEIKVQGKPYVVKFTLHDKVLQQVGAYLAVKRKLEGEGITPSEYIDVRVADRVYYK